MRALDESYGDCPMCGGPQLLEVPDCPDGHGAQCPDRVCAGCGSALFLDPPMISTRRPGVPHAA